MTYNSEIHHRYSIRLKEYDYSQAGLYFITICTKNRIHLFGEIDDGIMILNDKGEIAENEWLKSEKIRNEIILHEYVFMPNHFHGIVEIIVGANGCSPVQMHNSGFFMQKKSIGSLISGYKSSVTTKINKIRKSPGHPVWHRNYWEHIIRDEDEYFRISKYIKNNSLKWGNDKLNRHFKNIAMEFNAPYNEEVWMV